MMRKVLWTVVFSLIAAILQSTVLSHYTFYHAVPDLALGILVYTAYVNGMMAGQVSGFFYGLTLDFLSAAPLGLNMFVRTLVGAFLGLIRGNFILGALFLPMGLCAAATIFKALILFFLHLLFGDAVPMYPLKSPLLWAELTLNTLSAPLLFAFLRRFGALFTDREAVL